VVRCHYVTTAFSENVAGLNVTNHSYVHDETGAGLTLCSSDHSSLRLPFKNETTEIYKTRIIFPVTLCGFETCSVTIREGVWKRYRKIWFILSW
jgi:hypothetical protein